MMTDRELMQQALSALVTAELDGNCEYGVTDSLRARLAQPEPWVKTYSGGKPNYTQPVEPEPMIDGWPLYSGLPPVKVQDEREENYKSFAQSAQVLGAQHDPRRHPSGSWTSWDNTMCNPLANARMQTQSAWQDGYDSAKAEGYAPLEGNRDYERGYIDGWQKQIELAVHKAVKRVAERDWVGLTDEEIQAVHYELKVQTQGAIGTIGMYRMLEKALREKNT